MLALPLQIVDNFLLQYHIGQVFVLVLVLGLLGTLPLRNKTVTGLHIVSLGLLFLLTPLSLMGDDVIYRMLGIALVMVGPMIVVVGGD